MQALLPYLYAFLVGGALCLIGQILIDRTALTPARILSGYVVAGVLLGALGWYQPLIDFAGAGATVPLTGFGSLLARGVREAVAEKGLLGVLTGGLTKGAAGIAAAIFFSVLAALVFRSRDQRCPPWGQAAGAPRGAARRRRAPRSEIAGFGCAKTPCGPKLAPGRRRENCNFSQENGVRFDKLRKTLYNATRT